MDQNLNRFGFIRRGEWVGYDVDYAREIALALFGDSSKVQLRAVSSADRINVLNSGQVDLIADSMTITCERQQKHKLLFSTNYFTSGQKVLVHSDAPYRGLGDLGGRKVCAPESTTSIRTIAEHPAHPVPVSVVDWTDCLVLFQQSAVEAISTTDSVLVGLADQDPGTQIVGPRLTTEEHGLAMRNTEPELVRFVNAVLEQMRANGCWRKIYRRWLPDLEVKMPPKAVYAAEPRSSHPPAKAGGHAVGCVVR